MAEASQGKLKDFWETTAKRFATSGFKAVCTPTSIGLVNWYTDILQKTVLKRVLRQCKGARVLDCGCGVGRWSSRLIEMGADVIGIDIAKNMVMEANKRQLEQSSYAEAKFLVATVASLPFNDSTFDYALSVTVLQRIIDEEEAKKSALQILRVIRPGGKIIILEISTQRKQQSALDFPTAFRSTADWIALFTAEGRDAQLESLEGVDLSVFIRPLNRMKVKVTTGTEYTQQLSGNSSVRFIISKGLYYVLLNIAILLSLPIDLALRGRLLDQSVRKLFIFKKLGK